MRGVGAILAVVGLLTLGSGVNVFAATDDGSQIKTDDGSQIKIVSPAPGEKVKSDVELKYELKAGSQATHAHCFVDGVYQKGWDKKTVKGMSPGTHEIKVVAADKDHKMLAAEAAIKVEVQ